MQYPGFVSDFLSWLFARSAGDGLDTVNYTRIARDWYGFGDFGDDTYVQEYNIVFFPGFPLMIRALTALVGEYVVSGLILSNAFAIGSGLLLYALVSDMYSEPAARRRGRQ